MLKSIVFGALLVLCTAVLANEAVNNNSGFGGGKSGNGGGAGGTWVI